MADESEGGRQRRILHVTHGEGLSSVFPSQVLKPMSLLAKSGEDVSLLVFCPVGQFMRNELRSRWVDLLNNLPESLRGRLYRFPSPPSRTKGLWTGEAALKRTVKRFSVSSSRLILHCRGTRATMLALAVKRASPDVRVVYDCRGVEHAEVLYEAGYDDAESAPKVLRDCSARLYGEQRAAARSADAMICVSRKMKDYVIDEFGVSAERIAVVPCCASPPDDFDREGSRARIRRRLGLEGKFVVCYCGSVRRWQCPEESARLFCQICENLPNAHFLGLTPSPERLRAIFLDAGAQPDRLTVISVSQDQVFDYLAAADVGLLLRRESLVNRVSSPVKFAEYLAAGLPVLLSPGIGDYSSLQRSSECVMEAGSIFDTRGGDQTTFPVAESATNWKNLKERSLDLWKDQCTWSSHLVQAVALYELSDREAFG